MDTEAQTTDFVEDLVSTLEEQRRAIGSTPSPENDERLSTAEIEKIQETSGDYIVKIQNNRTRLATATDDNQSDAMAKTVDYLIENHDLISALEPLPYVPGRKNALINDEPIHPDDKGEMRTYRELANGYYLYTSLNKRAKKRHIERLANKCGLVVKFDGGW